MNTEQLIRRSSMKAVYLVCTLITSSSRWTLMERLGMTGRGIVSGTFWIVIGFILPTITIIDNVTFFVTIRTNELRYLNIGRVWTATITVNIMDINSFQLGHVIESSRIRIGSKIFHSKIYNRKGSTNSYTICFDNKNKTEFGEIQYFLNTKSKYLQN